VPDTVQDIDGTRVLVAGADGTPIGSGQDALELVASAHYDDIRWIAVPAA
jgi:hypothetical protein